MPSPAFRAPSAFPRGGVADPALVHFNGFWDEPDRLEVRRAVEEAERTATAGTPAEEGPLWTCSAHHAEGIYLACRQGFTDFIAATSAGCLADGIRTFFRPS